MEFVFEAKRCEPTVRRLEGLFRWSGAHGMFFFLLAYSVCLRESGDAAFGKLVLVAEEFVEKGITNESDSFKGVETLIFDDSLSNEFGVAEVFETTFLVGVFDHPNRFHGWSSKLFNPSRHFRTSATSFQRWASKTKFSLSRAKAWTHRKRYSARGR